jgi:hypothetical protein
MHPLGVVYAATAMGLPLRSGFACCSMVAKQELRSTWIIVEGLGLKGRSINLSIVDLL